ncbi:glycosyltransferase family 2 protein [Fulvivirgaceae bacterium BMA12]|uniref:Glycosyltransferase family 2 protein n=1 Tax=Agaribacillus aureus TaxID=3051825 RepID=A0ABT8KYI0_9BACT|nr:glycosyltransferase family 2 protein [Fulvivirgaceae bacterium BMA12]
MEKSNFYLQRYGFPKSLFFSDPHPDLGMIVVIPCFNEKDLIRSLSSLISCADTQCAVEILVIVNDSERASPEMLAQNQVTYEQSVLWAKKNDSPKRRILLHYESRLPHKQSGVGMARKIGMDEAVRRLDKANRDKGIIICFDADSQCDGNYLSAIEQHFSHHQKCNGASIYFEHPLEGDLSPAHYKGIIFYELFLRYYVNALRYAGFPFAYQTIGSSMAVRSDVYQKQGGMNKRKAGEDFYFLHKVIPLGNFHEINHTRVIPSARSSDRVPFGTGKAISDWLSRNEDHYLTYAPETFRDLKAFLDQASHLFRMKESAATRHLEKLPKSIATFLAENNFIENLNEINQYCGPTPEAFLKRFYAWFNGFKVLKFVHFSRDNFHGNVNIEKATQWLLSTHLEEQHVPVSAKAQLIKLRKIDREA